MTRSSNTEPAANLSARLQSRLPEIEQACLEQIYRIADPSTVADPSYEEGLRLAVSVALEFGLAALETSADAPKDPIPLALLAHVRAAARNGVSLDTVVRRCCAGDALLRSCLIEEAGKACLDSSTLKRLLRSQAGSFDRLLNAVGEEHRQARKPRLNPVERRTKRIEQLLTGESLDTTEIPYDFDAHHVGLIVTGPVKVEALRTLGHAFDRRVLVVPAGKNTLWAWLGGRQKLGTPNLNRLASAETWPFAESVTIGESSFGLPGWRFTHQQAQAALAIARRSSERINRYADKAIVSALVQDDLLVNSLNQLYLAPLEKERDQGQVLRETLRAYFASERTVSSAAALLGVKRHTVTNRLRTVEEIIGQPLTACATALEIALSLEELSSTRAEPVPPPDRDLFDT